MSIRPLKEYKKKERQVPYPIPCFTDRPFLWCIIARTASGKSVLISNLLRRPEFYYKKFNKVYMATSNIDDEGEITDKAYELIQFDKNNVFDEFNGEVFQNIKKDILEDEDWRNKNYLLVIDDLPYSLRNPLVGKILIKHRHINLSIIITSQKTNIIAPVIRSNLTHISIYKSMNKDEIEDLNATVDIDKKEFKSLLDYATKDPYNFLFIDVLKPRFYKNFDEELILTNDK